MYDETFFVTTPNMQSYKFFGDFTFDKDAEDCMGTGTLTMPYHPQLWAFWEPGFTELTIYGGTYDEERIFFGRTRGIKQAGEHIEISLQDCGWRLKQICYNEFTEEDDVEAAFIDLVMSAGMTPIIAGLTKSYKRENDEDSSATDSGKSAGTSSSSDTSSSASTKTPAKTPSKSPKKTPSKSPAKTPAKTSGMSTGSIFSSQVKILKSDVGIAIKVAKKVSSALNLVSKTVQKSIKGPVSVAASAAAKKGVSSMTITSSGLTSNSYVTGAALEGNDVAKKSTSGQPCISSNGTCSCGEKAGQKLKKSWKNYCPKCGGTNMHFVYTPMNMAGKNPEGRITCGDGKGNGGCDSDFCCTCGKNNDGTSSKRLTPCGSSGTSAGSSSSSSEDQGKEDAPRTYEDVIKEMCEKLDLMFYTTQFNEVILLDYESSVADIEKSAWEVKKEHMEYPSFNMDVSQFGYANTVVVKYKNGTVEEKYEDLVSVFGRVPKTYRQPTMSKTQAQKYAKGKLATLLRDFAMEIQITVLHSGRIQPGCFVKVENPITKHKEIYYVSGVNVSHSPSSTLKASLTLLYAPPNPEASSIPEIAGPANAKDVLAIIGNKASKFSYSGACQTGSCMEKTGSGDCWAMSDWIYNKLISYGIRAKIVQYGTSMSPRHRSVLYYSSGNWIDFPYRQYISKANSNFYNTGSSKSAPTFRGG